jgi:hypothetical protein
MPIDRAGPVPPYWGYIAETVLVPSTAPPTQTLLNLRTANLRWVYVPNYQRGISWQREEVEEFLSSDSVLLGNVILGQFPADAAVHQRFPYLPPDEPQYHVLVDGLQRLAVGTILLALLHERFLSPAPTRPNDAPHFAGLAALVQSRAAAYLHNDAEFRQHPRKAIRDQYEALRTTLDAWIEDEVGAGRVSMLAQEVTATMTTKQVAIDVYFNFPGDLALMNTFLGLNTVRVDLGPVDLLRSFLIEKAGSDGWSATDIEDVENQFTEVFTRDEHPDSELLPFVSVVLGAVRSAASAVAVFPSWSSSLSRNEVDRFLEFVSDMKSLHGNTYYEEIRSCGSNPFAIVLVYYYKKFLATGQPPSFLAGGSSEDGDLHKLLLACYRILLDGRIGRTREFAKSCLSGGHVATPLGDIAEAMSQQYLHLAISATVDPGWLRGTLLQADKSRAKRVFNAYLLTPKQQGYGAPFSPVRFGRRAVEFHIDHLIPESMLQQNSPGYAEANGVRNFAPLPSNQNRVAKATSCSSKLAVNGIYDAYIQGTTHPVHPFCVWLVGTHAQNFGPAALDNQTLLEVNAQPPAGDDRIDHLVAELTQRL